MAIGVGTMGGGGGIRDYGVGSEVSVFVGWRRCEYSDLMRVYDTGFTYIVGETHPMNRPHDPPNPHHPLPI